LRALVRFSSLVDAFTQRVGVVAYWLLPILVLVGVWNVFGRYFGQWVGTNLTSNVFIEAQWYIFSLVFLLGAPYALLHNEHVRVDVLYARLGQRKQSIINLVGTLLFLIPFCIFLIYFSQGSIASSWEILEDSPDPGGLPRYPIKTLIPLAIGMLMLQGISESIKNVARLAGVIPIESETAQPQQEHGGETTGDDSQTEHMVIVSTDAVHQTDAPAASPSEQATDPEEKPRLEQEQFQQQEKHP
jgi:TRAP-type mannitol/chloroaromatic compound transport system permease small subunit